MRKFFLICTLLMLAAFLQAQQPPPPLQSPIGEVYDGDTVYSPHLPLLFFDGGTVVQKDAFGEIRCVISRDYQFAPCSLLLSAPPGDYKATVELGSSTAYVYQYYYIPTMNSTHIKEGPQRNARLLRWLNPLSPDKFAMSEVQLE